MGAPQLLAGDSLRHGSKRSKALTPREHPRQARARETQAAILEDAARVFGERGYAATTTNHIAERAGVSIGTLYAYFPNKDAILAVLHAEHLQASRDLLERVVEQVRAPDGWQSVEAIARRFVEAVTAQREQDPALHEVLFEQAPLEPPSRAAFDVFQADPVKLAAGILRDHPERIGALRPLFGSRPDSTCLCQAGI